jgi:nucleotide-binding universal stress UspA family protein
MFKNVLVGVDGRPTGRDAIALAERLKDPTGKLTLAHVHTSELLPSHAITPGLLAEERRASAELLEEEHATTGVTAEVVSISAGSPGRGLHEHSEEEGADLLVVGSCHRGVLGRAMLGDDTRAALNGAPCAVAVAPAGYAEHAGPIADIGLAYNGSPESLAALAEARDLAAATGARIHALEVVSIPTVAYTGILPPAIGESIDVMLSEATARMTKLSDVKGSAVYGLTTEELARFSRDLDILIVGSRGFGPLKRLVMGSTSDYLERHAHCPLLVLPRPASVRAEGTPSAEDLREHSASEILV